MINAWFWKCDTKFSLPCERSKVKDRGQALAGERERERGGGGGGEAVNMQKYLKKKRYYSVKSSLGKEIEIRI